MCKHSCYGNKQKMETYLRRVLEARETAVDLEYSRSSIGKPVNIQTPLEDLLIQSWEGGRVDGKLHDLCRAVFKDGNFYEGDFKDGVMEGVGKYTWTDGLVYEGEMRCSKLTGRGKYTWPDGSTYCGDVVNGIRHGYGTYHSPITNTTYSGQWVEGKREGKGRLSYSSDEGDEGVMEESYYDGEWKNSRQHGTGTRRYRSGNVYSGEWRDGVKEGEGEMVWGGGRERYKGHWINNKPHGHGVYTWYNPPCLNHAQHPVSNRYEGQWRNGLRDGQGSFYYASGAVFRGEWSRGLKEGRGTFAFKNGETFSGLFHCDHMQHRHGEEEEGVETLLRPQTPLGSLIGDVGPEDGGQLSDKFNVNISPLLSPTHDVQTELSKVHSVVLQHIGQLKKVYHFYSSLGCDPLQHSHTLTRLQFWQFLKDCKLHHQGLSIFEADRIAALPPLCPSSRLLMREFLQSLVVLAHHLYSHTISGGVSSCLSHFITTHVLPNACSITGMVFAVSPHITTTHQEQSWQIYQLLSSTTSEDVPSVTMRALLWRFKECGLIPGLVEAGEVVNALVHDQPLAVDEQDYNLDVKITVLDILETVLQCCQSHDQSHDTPHDQSHDKSHDTSHDQSHDQSHEHSGVKKATVDQVLSLLVG